LKIVETTLLSIDVIAVVAAARVPATAANPPKTEIICLRFIKKAPPRQLVRQS
jgi:hypothetical protein